MKRITQLLALSLSLGSAGGAWAQSATATGTFLRQPVNPVMAVELDAGPVRAMPPGAGDSAAGSAGAGSLGSGRVGDRMGPSSAPMYTGSQNSQSMGGATPSPAALSGDRGRK